MINSFLTIEEINKAIKSPGLQKLKMKNNKKFIDKLKIFRVRKERSTARVNS